MIPHPRARALIELFKHLYEQRFRRALISNSNTDIWKMHEIVQDVGARGAEELIGYYFDVYKVEQSLTWFFYNYDKLLKDKKWEEQDREHIARLRQATKERLIEHIRSRD